jgi:hypothetical protein
MRNVSIQQKDAWIGNDMNIRVGSLNLDANNISFTKRLVDADRLDLVNAYFHQVSYPGRKPKSTIPVIVNNKTTLRDTGLQWNPQGWNIVLNQLQLTNATYRTDRGEKPPVPGAFDAAHLHFQNISGTVKSFRFIRDTLRAAVDITAKERSGLVVNRLQTHLRFHPQLMEFDKLFLKTNRSELGNYFAMKFDEIGDMSDFIRAVSMHANFKNTKLSSDDIAFFAPGIKDWNKTLLIDGKVKGTVDDLAGQNVHIRVGNSTALQGNFSVVGLPNIKETLINVEAKELRTNYADAVRFIPSLRQVKTPNLSKLGAIRFSGTYTGFYNDFVTYGTLQTALGTVKTDLNMKFPQKGEPVYSGNISTDGFQLGQFINNKDFGLIAFNGKVKGSSFTWNKLDLGIDGTIRKIRFQNYTYQNITAKGRLENRKFNGDFSINDPNAQARLSGLIDLSGDIPLFDVKASVKRLNLKPLGFSNEELLLTGDFDINASAKDIASILGSANVSNASLTLNGIVFHLIRYWFHQDILMV